MYVASIPIAPVPSTSARWSSHGWRPPMERACRIPRSQIEAGQSLGLSGLQVFRHVVIFPALKLMYPALASQFVLLMLATSVVSQISAQDLFHMASIIQSRTFRDFEVYILVAAAYLALAMAFRLLFAGLYQLVFARR